VDLNVGVAEALGTDYFYIREQLTSAQPDYLARTREFVTAEVQPVINGYWERAEFSCR
jgi:glutaryl-CoA dehydrogenase